MPPKTVKHNSKIIQINVESALVLRALNILLLPPIGLVSLIFVEIDKCSLMKHALELNSIVDITTSKSSTGLVWKWLSMTH